MNCIRVWHLLLGEMFGVCLAHLVEQHNIIFQAINVMKISMNAKWVLTIVCMNALCASTLWEDFSVAVRLDILEMGSIVKVYLIWSIITFLYQCFLWSLFEKRPAENYVHKIIVVYTCTYTTWFLTTKTKTRIILLSDISLVQNQGPGKYCLCITVCKCKLPHVLYSNIQIVVYSQDNVVVVAVSDKNELY